MEKQTVLIWKGSFCSFDENLGEINVYFKTRGDVGYN